MNHLLKLIFLVCVVLSPRLVLGEGVSNLNVISGLVDLPAKNQPISISQMMTVIYSSGSESSLWFVIGGSDQFEVYADQELRAYSVSFLLNEVDMICPTYHQFSFRWSGGSCPEPIPVDDGYIVSIYNGLHHRTHLYSCVKSYKVVDALNESTLYECVNQFTIEPS